MPVAGGHEIAAAAETLQLRPSETQLRQLDAFAGLLAQWSKTYNLTAVRDPAQILTHHLFDSMSLVGPLRRTLGDLAGRRLLDVGSGGGLPGVVVAILEPAIEVTCIDAVGKKAAFVQHVRATLSLGNLHSVHGRVEQLPKVDRYDVVCSRAFAALADFVGCTQGLLRQTGSWVAMKGRRPDAEIAALPKHVELFHVEQVQVPHLDVERHLVWMRPLS